jgi:hypothetical protein
LAGLGYIIGGSIIVIDAEQSWNSVVVFRVKGRFASKHDVLEMELVE